MTARRGSAFVIAGASLFLAQTARAYCPSYTAAGASCAVDPAPGNNPDDGTFRQYFGKIGTASFSAAEGPALDPMKAGCGKPTPPSTGAANFPCHVLYAIAMQESLWTQFCVPESPASQVGKPERTMVSFDCGFGIAQVTSGMRSGETPDFDQHRVASDTLYNMAVGAGILREKWEIVPCVGDRNPKVVEDWYTALWAYNGLAYVNNPNNPKNDPGRKPYDPQNGGTYTYQERVLGWMEHPSKSRWPAILPAYPKLSEIGTASKPGALSEPSCASPTSCTQTRSTNLSPCRDGLASDAGAPSDAGAAVGPAPDAGTGTATASLSGEGEAEAEGGCACTAAGRRERVRPAVGALFVMLGLLGRSRRRKVTASSRAARQSAPR